MPSNLDEEFKRAKLKATQELQQESEKRKAESDELQAALAMEMDRVKLGFERFVADFRPHEMTKFGFSLKILEPLSKSYWLSGKYATKVCVEYRGTVIKRSFSDENSFFVLADGSSLIMVSYTEERYSHGITSKRHELQPYKSGSELALELVRRLAEQQTRGGEVSLP